jgi:hypothetical protein
MKWASDDEAPNPCVENHIWRCLFESLNIPVFLQFRMKSVKAGISVERVTNDTKPIQIKDFCNFPKLPHGSIIPFAIRRFDDMDRTTASSGVSGWS